MATEKKKGDSKLADRIQKIGESIKQAHEDNNPQEVNLQLGRLHKLGEEVRGEIEDAHAGG